MTVRITPAQARALGVDTPNSRRRSTRRTASGPYRTRCTTCGDVFVSEAAETRHLDDTGHGRYELVLVPAVRP